MTSLSRRRFLSIAAASCLLPAGVSGAPAATWRGSALGAPASMQFAGLTQQEAASLIAAVEAELDRLEMIFSLYRPGSEISRLNAAGHLAQPSAELLNVLSLSAALHEASGGAFDPTIQPLWLALASGQSGDDLDKARAQVDFDRIVFDTDEIRFTGAQLAGALTLNGIAQGAVTDRIASVIRSFGMTDVLIDFGEVAALGLGADGAPWRAGVADPQGQIVHRVALSDRALATSAPAAMSLGSRAGHILHPNGAATVHTLVSVSAPTAAMADGLSTALCLVEPSRAASVLASFPGAKLEKMI